MRAHRLHLFLLAGGLCVSTAWAHTGQLLSTNSVQSRFDVVSFRMSASSEGTILLSNRTRQIIYITDGLGNALTALKPGASSSIEAQRCAVSGSLGISDLVGQEQHFAECLPGRFYALRSEAQTGESHR